MKPKFDDICICDIIVKICTISAFFFGCNFKIFCDVWEMVEVLGITMLNTKYIPKFTIKISHD